MNDLLLPNGKLFPDDEGALNVAVYVKDNKIVIDFGTLITWVALDKIAALDLINSVKTKLEQIR